MRSKSIAIAAIILTAACGGDDDSPSGPKTVAGTYPLVTYAGSALPAIAYQDATYKVEITAGSITLNANGSFNDSYTIRETEDGAVSTTTIPCSGTWAQSGNNIALQETETSVCGDVGTATWDGNNTLTISWEFLGGPTVHRR